MKKLLVLILTVTMLLPVVGIAEFDLASMTDQQLLLLNKELTAELLSRSKTAFIAIGEYVIGEEIPEGEYELTLDPDASESAKIMIIDRPKEGGINLQQGYVSKELTSGLKVVLNKGNILEIHYANVYMRKSYETIEFK